MWRVRFSFLDFFLSSTWKDKTRQMFFPIFWEEGLKLQRRYYQLVDFLQRFAISFEHLLSSSGPLTVLTRDEDIDSYWQQMDRKRSRREWQQSKFLLWTCLDYWNIDIFMFSQKIIFVYQNFLYFPRIWAKWRINLSLSEGALMLSVTLTTPRDQETREISTSKAPQNLKRVL